MLAFSVYTFTVHGESHMTKTPTPPTIRPIPKAGDEAKPTTEATASAGATQTPPTDAQSLAAQGKSDDQTANGTGSGAAASDEHQESPEAKKAREDAEFEAALNEPNKVPTPSEKDLDEADVGELGATLEEAKSTASENEEHIASIRAHAEKVGDEDTLRFLETRDKIIKMADMVPKDSEDEQILWGYGGLKLMLGDIRIIASKLR